MELQSGFVLAVLVAAVLLADRIGGSDELGRRLFQIALAAVAAFLVVAVSGLIFDPGDAFTGAGGFGDEDATDGADEYLAAQTAQVGAGAVLVILGLSMMRRFTTLPVAIMLGGVLLVVFGGSRSPAGATSIFAIFSTFVPASDDAQVANILVLAAALGGLLWWGMNQYEPTASDMNEGDSGGFARPANDVDAHTMYCP